MHAKLPKTSLREVLYGLKHAINNEFSMHLIICSWIIMLMISYILCFNSFELAIVIMLLGLITATELINTSLEAVVDLVSPNIHPITKVAKDTASAATAIFSITAFICFLLMIISNLMKVGILWIEMI